MTGLTYLWLALSTAVFVGANGVLKTYAVKGGWPILMAALLLFCIGNFIMVQVMRGSGLGLAIAISAVFQLLAINAMAMVVFGERPTALQLAGIVLGVVAVALIAWPTGGKV